MGPLYGEVLGAMGVALLCKGKKHNKLGQAGWPCCERVLLYPTSL